MNGLTEAWDIYLVVTCKFYIVEHYRTDFSLKSFKCSLKKTFYPPKYVYFNVSQSNTCAKKIVSKKKKMFP